MENPREAEVILTGRIKSFIKDALESTEMEDDFYTKLETYSRLNTISSCEESGRIPFALVKHVHQTLNNG